MVSKNQSSVGNSMLTEMNMNSDKRLKGLLPPIPHIVENLNFAGLNNWACTLNVALLTQKDCQKWLAEFQDITKTQWLEEKSTQSLGGSTWRYKCSYNGPNSNWCLARLELRLSQEKGLARRYPCMIDINFHHNHIAVPTGCMGANGEILNPQRHQHQQPIYQVQEIETLLMGSGSGPADPQPFIQSNQVIQSVDQLPSLADNNIIVPASKLPRDSDQANPSEETKRFYAAIQSLWILFQNGGDSTSAVDQFTERFTSLRSMNDDKVLHQALSNFGSSGPSRNPNTEGPANAQALRVSRPTMEPNRRKLHKRLGTKCGSCKSCMGENFTDCRECRNCLDQKRYGGPGKLKKACLRRVSCSSNCERVKVSESSLPAEISLPLHPIPLADISTMAIAPAPNIRRSP